MYRAQAVFRSVFNPLALLDSTRLRKAVAGKDGVVQCCAWSRPWRADRGRNNLLGWGAGARAKA